MDRSKTIDDFIYKFLHLEGTTIADKMQSYTWLLKRYECFLKENEVIDFVSKNIKPTTYLQEKMLVNFLIHYRRHEELLIIFQHETDIPNSKLWKQKWLFEHLLQIFNPHEIVGKIFTNLSYLTRMRFLANLMYYSSSENQVDEFYKLLLKKYGSKAAHSVVAGCSLPKIKHILSDPRQRLTKKQLLFLHKKSYLTEIQKTEECWNKLNLSNYQAKPLSTISASDFKFLYEKSSAREFSYLGKTLTKKLLANERNFVINNADKLQHILHKRTLLKGLKGDLKNFIYKTWPCRFDKFDINATLQLLKFYPKENIFHFIRNGLTEVYNKSFEDRPDLIVEKILRYTKNINDRNYLLKIKTKEIADDFIYIKYRPMTDALRILTRKINETDVASKKMYFAKILIESCIINEDYNTLLHVLERYNNNVISTVLLNEIKMGGLKQLTLTHWRFIIDLVKVNQCENGFFIYYLKFLVSNGYSRLEIEKCIRENAVNLVKDIKNWEWLKEFPKVGGDILICLRQELSRITRQSSQNGWTFLIFKGICNWNKWNPKHPVVYKYGKFELGDICHAFKRDTYENRLMVDILTRKVHCSLELITHLQFMFWENFDNYFNHDILAFFLRKQPEIFLNYQQAIFSKIKLILTGNKKRFWRLLKHYEHIRLPQKFVDHYKSYALYNGLNKISGEILASILPTHEYLSYIPVPHTRGNQNVRHTTIKTLLRFTKLSNDYTVIPKIVLFYITPAFSTGLDVIYYYFNHTPEKHLNDFIQIIITNNLIRRHAVNITCTISTVDTTYKTMNLLITLPLKDKERIYVFKKNFKYFLCDLGDDFLSLLQSQIKNAAGTNRTLSYSYCKVLLHPSNISTNYNGLWQIHMDLLQIHKVTSAPIVMFYTTQLISSFTSERLSEEIKKNFLNTDYIWNQQRLNIFICHMFKYSMKTELLIQTLFEVIADYKTKQFDSKVKLELRKWLDAFISLFCCEFAPNTKRYINVITLVYFHWRNIFHPVENINSTIHLTLLFELMQINDLYVYVTKVEEIFVGFVMEFGITGTISCFNAALHLLLPNHLFNIPALLMKYQFIYKLVTFSKNIHCKLLAMDMIDLEIPDDRECAALYLASLSALRNVDNCVVKANLEILLSDLTL